MSGRKWRTLEWQVPTEGAFIAQWNASILLRPIRYREIREERVNPNVFGELCSLLIVPDELLHRTSEKHPKTHRYGNGFTQAYELPRARCRREQRQAIPSFRKCTRPPVWRTDRFVSLFVSQGDHRIYAHRA